jgi:hypothetical protein
MDKKAIGKFSFDSITNIMLVVVGVVVLFQVVASLFPTLVTSGETLSNSSFPLGSLFATAGSAGWYLLAIGVILVIIKAVLPSGKK